MVSVLSDPCIPRGYITLQGYIFRLLFCASIGMMSQVLCSVSVTITHEGTATDGSRRAAVKKAELLIHRYISHSVLSRHGDSTVRHSFEKGPVPTFQRPAWHVLPRSSNRYSPSQSESLLRA